MPTLSTLLSRRGRKHAQETNLDSVWGDISITSPTDALPLWDDVKAKNVIVSVAEDSVVEVNAGATTTREKPGNVVKFADLHIPPTQQGVKLNEPLGQPSVVILRQPQPNRAKQLSQTRPYPPIQQPDTSARHIPRSVTTHLEQKTESTVTTNHNYVYPNTPYSASTRVNGILTPPMTTSDMCSNQYPQGGNASRDPTYEEEKSTWYSNPTTPLDSASVSRRPRWMSSSTPTESRKTPDLRTAFNPSYSGPNVIAIESVHSPIVTILSPVSEAFPAEENGGITIVGNTNDATAQPSYILPLFDFENDRSISSVIHPENSTQNILGVVETNTDSERPSFDRDANPSRLSGLHSPAPSSSHSEKISMMVDVEQAVHMPGRSALVSPAETIFQDFDESFTPILPPKKRLSGVEQAGRASNEPHRHRISPMETSSASNTKLQPMGVTGVMRMSPQPLGMSSVAPACSADVDEEGEVCCKCSVSISSDDTQPAVLGARRGRTMHGKGPSLNSASVGRQGLPAAPNVAKAQRMRSQSLEPPASPSFFNGSASYIAVPKSVISQPARGHRRMQSVDAVDRSRFATTSQGGGRFDSHDQNPNGVRRATSNIRYDPGAMSKRSRSQAPLEESPDLRKRVAFSDSPDPNNEPDFTTTTAQPGAPRGFYDEVRHDYKTVSRDAFKSNATAQPLRSNPTRATDKRSKKLRNRSTSRPRDRSTSRPRDRSQKRRPGGEETEDEQEGDELSETHPVPPELVPSYDDIWA